MLDLIKQQKHNQLKQLQNRLKQLQEEYRIRFGTEFLIPVICKLDKHPEEEQEQEQIPEYFSNPTPVKSNFSIQPPSQVPVQQSFENPILGSKQTIEPVKIQSQNDQLSYPRKTKTRTKKRPLYSEKLVAKYWIRPFDQHSVVKIECTDPSDRLIYFTNMNQPRASTIKQLKCRKSPYKPNCIIITGLRSMNNPNRRGNHRRRPHPTELDIPSSPSQSDSDEDFIL
jgi:hypothetical protein